MSQSSSTKKGVNPWVGLVVGLLIMVGGMFLYASGTFSGIEKPLEAQGVPVNISKTISSLGVLLMLFPVVRLFFIDPLAQAINERTVQLEATFGEATELRDRMDKMKAEYEQRLVATEAEAREKIQSQIKEAQALRTQLVAEATQKADDLIKQAREEIESDRNRVMTEVRVHVVDLALAAATKVVSENMDTDRNRKLVQEFIDTVEVKA